MQLRLSNAREHNLDGVDLNLPHDALVVFCGPSGSGKSSLAFDTIYRESERRYLESISPRARRLVARLERPNIDRIDGLRPALALRQRRFRGGQRSTLGTLSDLWAPLRLLFAKHGSAHCPNCSSPLTRISPERLLEVLTRRFAARHFTLLAPRVDGHRGAQREELERLQRAGCSELWIDGERLASAPLPSPEPSRRHRIAGVIADWDARASGPELRQAVQRALALGEGVLWIECAGELERFSTRLACAECDAPVQAQGPRLFSFNSSYGACPACQGIGLEDRVDPQLLVADASRSLRQGALVPTTPSGYIVYSQVTIEVLDSVCQAHGFSVDDPWEELTDEQKGVVLYGSKRLEVPFGKHPLESRLKWKGITARPRENGHYPGLVPTIEETLKRNRNANILRFARSLPCSACAGSRLAPQALAVRLGQHSIAYFAALALSELASELEHALEGRGATLMQSLRASLEPLLELGLGYLSLERPAASLSAGESQRLCLGTQLGSPLAGMLYVLDEPSIGLHASEREQLYGLLGRLRDVGSSVLVVEHDPLSLMRADWLVEVGPGAGQQGGRILYSGPPAAWPSLRERPSIEPQAAFEQDAGPLRSRAALILRNVCARNLKNLEVKIPLHAMTAISGVSGAGKSTLMQEVLAPALGARGRAGAPAFLGSLEGHESIDALIQVDSAPIGRTPRSNPATYTGLFDAIRTHFASLPEARERGINKGQFSFNTRGGRCEGCEGAGQLSIGMHGLATQWVTCPSCAGRRFLDAVLEVRWKGLSILDVLGCSVDQALDHFRELPKIQRYLEALQALGLGYLSLGQPAPTLSGGEAQRIKLARELARPQKGHVLYLLDEPASGLAELDVRVLARALRRLVAAGHSLVIIEHNTWLLSQADQILDLGPGSGEAGGRLVECGSPPELAARARSATGRALAQLAAQGPFQAHPIPRSSIPHEAISTRLRGASTHNLKSIDLELRAGELTLLTGVSGSGKSSLAWHTLHAEAQRRFLSGLSSHARRQLKVLLPGQFESVQGLTASLALGQEPTQASSRSTVGTLSELLEDLRLLFARFSDAEGLQARHFSFNHGQGACPSCEGAGRSLRCDPAKLVSHPERSLLEGAMAGSKAGAFYGEAGGQHLAILEALERELELDLQAPFAELSPGARELALHGSGERLWDVQWNFERKGRQGEHLWRTTWLGFCGYIDVEYERKRSAGRGQELLDLLSETTCKCCAGERLASAARQARLGSMRLPELCALPASELASWLAELQLAPAWQAAAEPLRLRLMERLGRLESLGLGYLPLERRASELSGGESQRLRLLGRLVSQLDGLTYLLDEPTQGLHASDRSRLMGTLRALLTGSNRVLVLEHDPAVIAQADRVLELGPGAGRLGGEWIAQGTPAEVALLDTPTGRALGERLRLSEGRTLSAPIRIRGASIHNLKGLNVDLPTGGLLVLSGVSGSGKSSLCFDVLAASAQAGRPVGCTAIEGLEDFERVISLGQRAPSAQPTQTPLGLLGLMPELGKLLAQGERARQEGHKPGFFSLGSKGGRCEACRGLGRVREDLDFLGERWLSCEGCAGKRYGPEALACHFEGWTPAAILELDVQAAQGLFKQQLKLGAGLALLEEIGLGYLSLGQPLDTLSGGEAQRLRLAAELWSGGSPGKGKRLYLLDEPTTGLHPEDVDALLKLFRRLTAAGHSLMLIEHDLRLIARADHVLDLGPGAGPAGGSVVFSGSPWALSRCADSLTGQALASAWPSC